jgi:hypothetical protein
VIYVESPVRNWPRGIFREFTLHTEQVELFTLSTSLYQDSTDATLTSVSTDDVDSGLTISNAATADPLWTARLSASVAGLYTFCLVVVYSNGETQRLEFLARVVNP